MMPMSCETTKVWSKPRVVDDGADVGCLGLLVVSAGGAGGAPDAAKVGHDDGVVFDEFGSERSPGVAGFGVAVDENDHGAGAREADEDVGASRAMDHLGFEVGGQGWLAPTLCVCRPGLRRL